MSGNDSASAIADTPTALRRIRILDIRENESALRKCNRDTVEFKELLESVRANGVIQTITVRECVDPTTNSPFYGLIDGLQRFTAAKDAGLDELDVKVIKASDYEVLEKQLILNVQRIETTPAQYSQQLKRMLNMNPQLTVVELAHKIGKSPEFIYDRLSLLELEESIAKLVDDGKIPLSNAYGLAKLPVEEQANYSKAAQTETLQEFMPKITNRVKEINKAARTGQNVAPAVWAPTPRQRKLSEVKEEFENPKLGSAICAKAGVTSAVDGFALGVKWALHMDADSIEQQRQKEEAKKKEAEDAKARKKKEAEERAAAEAAKIK